MKIHLPNSAWIHNIDHFIKSFDVSDESILEITSHKKWVSGHPVVLCMITALTLFMKRNGAKVNFEKMEAKSKHYFERMGLYALIGEKSGIKIKSKDSTGRFIPIRKITNYDGLSEFIQEITPIYHLKPEQVQPINFVLSELVRNVFEHALSDFGAIVCVQYHKDKNTIRIGVVDTGVGIKKTLYLHRPKNDVEALLLALTPGITGTTKKIGGYSEMNAGAGLFQIRCLAKACRNFFMIYSDKALYKLLQTKKTEKIRIITDPANERFHSYENFPRWHGTVVAIDLCLDDTFNFNSMLDEIRKSYRIGRKEQIKKRYKKPTFV